MIDTFSVSFSTVLIDSLPSSAIDTFLIGNFEDNIFGKVTCNGYFELGLPSNTEAEEDDIFDSLTLCLSYTGYSYGDTSQIIQILFYRLLNQIEVTETGYLYNTSFVLHDNNPVASYAFYPKPNSKDTIEIHASDALGTELLNLMKSNDEIMDSEDNFIDFFKGLVIKADTSLNGSIIGFNAESDAIMMKLYSHRSGATEEAIVYDFPLVSPEKQFNQILHNFNNTPLKIVKQSNEAISSAYMDDKSYSQGGIGLMTKLQFPSMNDFLLYENAFVVLAELTIRPMRLSYNTFNLPESIYLYNTDKHNELGTILVDETGEIITPVFYYDEIFNEATYYTFNITSFITGELWDNYFDPEHGLLITFSYEEYLCSLKRIVFDASRQNVQLKIYYVNY